jgi:ribonuclease HI
VVFNPSVSLVTSPSPLRPAAWASLLRNYTGPHASLLDGILKDGAHESRVVLMALRLFSANWHHHKLIVHTDSTVVYHALNNHYSRPSAQFMTLLKEVLPLAASRDIIINPQWLSTHANTLADALSRLDGCKVANICPHWQVTPLDTNLQALSWPKPAS